MLAPQPIPTAAENAAPSHAGSSPPRSPHHGDAASAPAIAARRILIQDYVRRCELAGSDGMTDVIEYFSSMQPLHAIDLTDKRIGSGAVLNAFLGVLDLLAVKQLVLDHCIGIRPVDTLRLSSFIVEHPTLAKVSIRGWPIQIDLAERFLRAVDKNRRLHLVAVDTSTAAEVALLQRIDQACERNASSGGVAAAPTSRVRAAGADDSDEDDDDDDDDTDLADDTAGRSLDSRFATSASRALGGSGQEDPSRARSPRAQMNTSSFQSFMRSGGGSMRNSPSKTSSRGAMAGGGGAASTAGIRIRRDTTPKPLPAARALHAVAAGALRPVGDAGITTRFTLFGLLAVGRMAATSRVREDSDAGSPLLTYLSAPGSSSPLAPSPAQGGEAENPEREAAVMEQRYALAFTVYRDGHLHCVARESEAEHGVPANVLDDPAFFSTVPDRGSGDAASTVCSSCLRTQTTPSDNQDDQSSFARLLGDVAADLDVIWTRRAESINQSAAPPDSRHLLAATLAVVDCCLRPADAAVARRIILDERPLLLDATLLYQADAATAAARRIPRSPEERALWNTARLCISSDACRETLRAVIVHRAAGICSGICGIPRLELGYEYRGSAGSSSPEGGGSAKQDRAVPDARCALTLTHVLMGTVGVDELRRSCSAVDTAGTVFRSPGTSDDSFTPACARALAEGSALNAALACAAQSSRSVSLSSAATDAAISKGRKLLAENSQSASFSNVPLPTGYAVACVAAELLAGVSGDQRASPFIPFCVWRSQEESLAWPEWRPRRDMHRHLASPMEGWWRARPAAEAVFHYIARIASTINGTSPIVGIEWRHEWGALRGDSVDAVELVSSAATPNAHRLLAGAGTDAHSQYSLKVPSRGGSMTPESGQFLTDRDSDLDDVRVDRSFTLGGGGGSGVHLAEAAADGIEYDNPAQFEQLHVDDRATASVAHSIEQLSPLDGDPSAGTRPQSLRSEALSDHKTVTRDREHSRGRLTAPKAAVVVGVRILDSGFERATTHITSEQLEFELEVDGTQFWAPAWMIEDGAAKYGVWAVSRVSARHAMSVADVAAKVARIEAAGGDRRSNEASTRELLMRRGELAAGPEVPLKWPTGLAEVMSALRDIAARPTLAEAFVWLWQAHDPSASEGPSVFAPISVDSFDDQMRDSFNAAAKPIVAKIHAVARDSGNSLNNLLVEQGCLTRSDAVWRYRSGADEPVLRNFWLPMWRSQNEHGGLLHQLTAAAAGFCRRLYGLGVDQGAHFPLLAPLPPPEPLSPRSQAAALQNKPPTQAFKNFASGSRDGDRPQPRPFFADERASILANCITAGDVIESIMPHCRVRVAAQPQKASSTSSGPRQSVSTASASGAVAVRSQQHPGAATGEHPGAPGDTDTDDLQPLVYDHMWDAIAASQAFEDGLSPTLVFDAGYPIEIASAALKMCLFRPKDRDGAGIESMVLTLELANSVDGSAFSVVGTQTITVAELLVDEFDSTDGYRSVPARDITVATAVHSGPFQHWRLRFLVEEADDTAAVAASAASFRHTVAKSFAAAPTADQLRTKESKNAATADSKPIPCIKRLNFNHIPQRPSIYTFPLGIQNTWLFGSGNQSAVIDLDCDPRERVDGTIDVAPARSDALELLGVGNVQVLIPIGSSQILAVGGSEAAQADSWSMQLARPLERITESRHLAGLPAPFNATIDVAVPLRWESDVRRSPSWAGYGLEAAAGKHGVPPVLLISGALWMVQRFSDGMPIVLPRSLQYLCGRPMAELDANDDFSRQSVQNMPPKAFPFDEVAWAIPATTVTQAHTVGLDTPGDVWYFASTDGRYVPWLLPFADSVTTGADATLREVKMLQSINAASATSAAGGAGVRGRGGAGGSSVLKRAPPKTWYNASALPIARSFLKPLWPSVDIGAAIRQDPVARCEYERLARRRSSEGAPLDIAGALGAQVVLVAPKSAVKSTAQVSHIEPGLDFDEDGGSSSGDDDRDEKEGVITDGGFDRAFETPASACSPEAILATSGWAATPVIYFGGRPGCSLTFRLRKPVAISAITVIAAARSTHWTLTAVTSGGAEATAGEFTQTRYCVTIPTPSSLVSSQWTLRSGSSCVFGVYSVVLWPADGLHLSGGAPFEWADSLQWFPVPVSHKATSANFAPQLRARPYSLVCGLRVAEAWPDPINGVLDSLTLPTGSVTASLRRAEPRRGDPSLTLSPTDASLGSLDPLWSGNLRVPLGRRGDPAAYFSPCLARFASFHVAGPLGLGAAAATGAPSSPPTFVASAAVGVLPEVVAGAARFGEDSYVTCLQQSAILRCATTYFALRPVFVGVASKAVVTAIRDGRLKASVEIQNGAAAFTVPLALFCEDTAAAAEVHLVTEGHWCASFLASASFHVSLTDLADSPASGGCLTPQQSRPPSRGSHRSSPSPPPDDFGPALLPHQESTVGDAVLTVASPEPSTTFAPRGDGTPPLTDSQQQSKLNDSSPVSPTKIRGMKLMRLYLLSPQCATVSAVDAATGAVRSDGQLDSQPRVSLALPLSNMTPASQAPVCTVVNEGRSAELRVSLPEKSVAHDIQLTVSNLRIRPSGSPGAAIVPASDIEAWTAVTADAGMVEARFGLEWIMVPDAQLSVHVPEVPTVSSPTSSAKPSPASQAYEDTANTAILQLSIAPAERAAAFDAVVSQRIGTTTSAMIDAIRVRWGGSAQREASSSPNNASWFSFDVLGVSVSNGDRVPSDEFASRRVIAQSGQCTYGKSAIDVDLREVVLPAVEGSAVEHAAICGEYYCGVSIGPITSLASITPGASDESLRANVRRLSNVTFEVQAEELPGVMRTIATVHANERATWPQVLRCRRWRLVCVEVEHERLSADHERFAAPLAGQMRFSAQFLERGFAPVFQPVAIERRGVRVKTNLTVYPHRMSLIELVSAMSRTPGSITSSSADNASNPATLSNPGSTAKPANSKKSGMLCFIVPRDQSVTTLFIQYDFGMSAPALARVALRTAVLAREMVDVELAVQYSDDNVEYKTAALHVQRANIGDTWQTSTWSERVGSHRYWRLQVPIVRDNRVTFADDTKGDEYSRRIVHALSSVVWYSLAGAVTPSIAAVTPDVPEILRKGSAFVSIPPFITPADTVYATSAMPLTLGLLDRVNVPSQEYEKVLLGRVPPSVTRAVSNLDEKFELAVPDLINPHAWHFDGKDPKPNAEFWLHESDATDLEIGRAEVFPNEKEELPVVRVGGILSKPFLSIDRALVQIECRWMHNGSRLAPATIVTLSFRTGSADAVTLSDHFGRGLTPIIAPTLSKEGQQSPWLIMSNRTFSLPTGTALMMPLENTQGFDELDWAIGIVRGSNLVYSDQPRAIAKRLRDPLLKAAFEFMVAGAGTEAESAEAARKQRSSYLNVVARVSKTAPCLPSLSFDLSKKVNRLLGNMFHTTHLPGTVSVVDMSDDLASSGDVASEERAATKLGLQLVVEEAMCPFVSGELGRWRVSASVAGRTISPNATESDATIDPAELQLEVIATSARGFVPSFLQLTGATIDRAELTTVSGPLRVTAPVAVIGVLSLDAACSMPFSLEIDQARRLGRFTATAERLPLNNLIAATTGVRGPCDSGDDYFAGSSECIVTHVTLTCTFAVGSVDNPVAISGNLMWPSAISGAPAAPLKGYVSDTLYLEASISRFSLGHGAPAAQDACLTITWADGMGPTAVHATLQATTFDRGNARAGSTIIVPTELTVHFGSVTCALLSFEDRRGSIFGHQQHRAEDAGGGAHTGITQLVALGACSGQYRGPRQSTWETAWFVDPSEPPTLAHAEGTLRSPPGPPVHRQPGWAPPRDLKAASSASSPASRRSVASRSTRLTPSHSLQSMSLTPAGGHEPL